MNFPNIITLGRLLSVPLTIWLIVSGELGLAFWLFVAAGVSDAIDGFLAKRYNQRTRLGALLDPIADKALLVSVYVALGAIGTLPLWLVIMVVFRDLLIVGGIMFLMALAQPIRWEPLLVSKLNTVLQIVLVALILAPDGIAVDHFPAASAALVYAVGVTTFLSGGAYVVRWARALTGVEQAS